MSDEDIAVEEKRIYGDTREVTNVYVASTLGLAHVTVSGDQAGRMNLLVHQPVADVSGGRGYLLAATDDDVYLGTDGPAAASDLEGTGFGPAVAVGVGVDALVAAGPDGTVARLAGDDWVTVGSVDEPRRFDGAYLATGDGVVRVDRGTDALVDLDFGPSADPGSDRSRDAPEVRDVAAAGPYAATDDGLYRLEGDEWTVAREGGCERVCAGGDDTHLVADGDLFERVGDEWFPCHLPIEGAIADVAYGEVPYAMTTDGTFLVDADPTSTPDGGSAGWRHRSLGLPSVRALAIP